MLERQHVAQTWGRLHDGPELPPPFHETHTSTRSGVNHSARLDVTAFDQRTVPPGECLRPSALKNAYKRSWHDADDHPVQQCCHVTTSTLQRIDENCSLQLSCSCSITLGGSSSAASLSWLEQRQRAPAGPCYYTTILTERAARTARRWPMMSLTAWCGAGS